MVSDVNVIDGVGEQDITESASADAMKERHETVDIEKAV